MCSTVPPGTFHLVIKSPVVTRRVLCPGLFHVLVKGEGPVLPDLMDLSYLAAGASYDQYFSLS